MVTVGKPRNQIGPFVAKHITPIMKSFGFVKRGTTFRRVSARGDHAALSVQRLSSLVEEEVPFRIVVGIVPDPWWDYLCMIRNLVPAPDIGSCQAYDAIQQLIVLPTEDGSGVDPAGSDFSEWRFIWGRSDDTVGNALAQRLGHVIGELVPDLLEDRQKLVEYLRVGQIPAGTVSWISPGLRNKIPFLLVDDGPSDALNTALQDARGDFGDRVESLQRYIKWFEQRLTAARRRGKMSFILDVQDDWPPVAVETLWVSQVGPETYEERYSRND